MMRQYARRSKQRGLLDPYRFGSGGIVDAPFSEVQLLLHGDGSDGGTVITDSSTANRTRTIVGAVVTSTTSPAIGTASLYFDGASRLHFPQATSLDLGASDFTIEMRVKFLNALPTTSVPATFLAKYTGTGASQRAYRITADFTSGQKINFRYTSADVETNILFNPESVVTIALGTWYAFAFCRTANVLKGFLNGLVMTPTTSDALSATLDTVTGVTSVGANVSSGSTIHKLDGNIDELRLTIGTARYTSAYTVATAAFPDA